jgi:hypothetical protein
MKTSLTIFALACLCGFALAQEVVVAYPAFKVPTAPSVEHAPRPRHDYVQVAPAAVELRLTKFIAPRIKTDAAKPVSLGSLTQPAATWKPASVEPVRPIKPFKVKLLTRWSPVWGFEMKEMLDRIEAAEKAGDTKTYEALTKTFTIWADSYLVQPDTRQNP